MDLYNEIFKLLDAMQTRYTIVSVLNIVLFIWVSIYLYINVPKFFKNKSVHVSKVLNIRIKTSLLVKLLRISIVVFIVSVTYNNIHSIIILSQCFDTIHKVVEHFMPSIYTMVSL